MRCVILVLAYYCVRYIRSKSHNKNNVYLRGGPPSRTLGRRRRGRRRGPLRRLLLPADPPEGGERAYVEEDEGDEGEERGEEGIEADAVGLVVGRVAAEGSLVGEAVNVADLETWRR